MGGGRSREVEKKMRLEGETGGMKMKEQDGEKLRLDREGQTVRAISCESGGVGGQALKEVGSTGWEGERE